MINAMNSFLVTHLDDPGPDAILYGHYLYELQPVASRPCADTVYRVMHSKSQSTRRLDFVFDCSANFLIIFRSIL